MPVSTYRRRQILTDILLEKGEVSAKEAASRFKVTMETIRKDLHALELAGTARKVYGGAVLARPGTEQQLEIRLKQAGRKQEIGRTAASLLEGASSVILDAGSTVAAAVPYINRMGSMDILTNSLEAFEALDGTVHYVYLCGGRKREKNRALTGAPAEAAVRAFHADACLMGTAGLLGTSGPTSHSWSELSLKQAMCQSAARVYVLADSSKFRDTGLHEWASWDVIDGLVADAGLCQEDQDRLSGKVEILQEVSAEEM